MAIRPAWAARQLPDRLDRIKVGTVGRQEVQAEMILALLPPIFDEDAHGEIEHCP